LEQKEVIRGKGKLVKSLEEVKQVADYSALPFKPSDFAKKEQEVVVFVGSPGCGKSTFWKNYMPEYVRVNNDTLKTPEKCQKVCKEALEQGKSAVIDNTNPTPDVRKRYISIAESFKVPVRCFYFEVEKERCLHNNQQRAANLHHLHLSSRVPKIPIHSFFKNSIKPTIKEGFSEVKVIEFKAGPFDNDDDKAAYFTLS